MFSIAGLQFADKGFYINLDGSINRKIHVENQIARYRIVGLERVSASQDQWRQSSCTKSHLAVFARAKEEQLETIFVGEDDFDIRHHTVPTAHFTAESILQYLSKIHSQLSSVEWDVFLLGYCPKSPLITIPDVENCVKVYHSTGGWAYLIKRKAYEFILEHSNYRRDLLAIDDWLPKLSYYGFNVIGAVPLAIHHAVGFESTLQPNGPVNYDLMIEGYFEKNYKTPTDKSVINRDLTIVITGHACENYLSYLNCLMQSLPSDLKTCRFIVVYDSNTALQKGAFERAIGHYFINYGGGINVTTEVVSGDLLNSIKLALKHIHTPYFMWLEHDWVFLQKNRVDFPALLKAFDTHSFINAVWFNKYDNSIRDFEIETDGTGKVTPFDKEDRVAETDLITTCRWSNDPAVFRVDKFKEWISTRCDSSIEEDIIPQYRKHIASDSWESVRDQWGTFLYGKMNDAPYVGHTDASRKYLAPHMRNTPEINGDKWIADNQLPTIDSPM